MKKLVVLSVLVSIVSCVSIPKDPKVQLVNILTTVLKNETKYNDEAEIAKVNENLGGLIGEILVRAKSPQTCTENLYLLSKEIDLMRQASYIPSESQIQDIQNFVNKACEEK